MEPTSVVLALLDDAPWAELAARGASFLDCTAPHLPTDPAVGTILTGKDAFAHGVFRDGDERDVAVPLIGDLLAERGVENAPGQRQFLYVTRELVELPSALLVAVGVVGRSV